MQKCFYKYISGICELKAVDQKVFCCKDCNVMLVIQIFLNTSTFYRYRLDASLKGKTKQLLFQHFNTQNRKKLTKKNKLMSYF